MKEHPNFEIGETQKFFNARFNREFENTLLDTFRPDNAIRCVDVYGDSGWVVGWHKAIDIGTRTIPGYHQVFRDRDQAVVGIPDSKLRMDIREEKKCYPAKKRV